jgi:hypothetical protein
VNEKGIYTFLITSLLVNALSNNPQNFSIQGNITEKADGQAYGDDWLFHNANMFKVNSSESANWTKFRIDSWIEGLSYSTEGKTIKVALCILLCYCLCATTHFLYSIISGLSSSSWDTIAEMVALAMNSPPVRGFGNTCTGIRTTGIFKEPVKIESTPGVSKHNHKCGNEKVDMTHLALVFIESQHELCHTAVVVGKEYGTTPGECLVL